MRIRVIWIVPVVVLGAGFAVWRLARGPVSSAVPSAAEEAGERAAARASIARAVDPLAFVSSRAGRDDANTFSELVSAYGGWASRPEALEARRLIIRTLLGHPNPKVGIEALLRAVEGDQTPRNQDPLWSELVQGLASRWDAVTFSMGRDLMALEERAKPKDLLLDSLTSAQPEKLADDQKPLLAADLIDMYPSLRPDQRPSVDKALAALAGRDVVEIAHGRGLAEGSTDLKLAADRQRVIEAAKRNPVKDKPPEE